ncbi:MAG: DnaA/Hda family protein [Rhodospirillales bacterium]|nr:DnaA/Hda family protein [Rhodospirillales bacterium]
MSDRAQLALGFVSSPALGCADFLVAANNADAAGWLRRWPVWPTPALIVHGPEGCGKTHLAHAFAARTNAPIIPARDLPRIDPLAILAGTPGVVIDDAEACTGAGERILLHLVNAVGETGRTLLLTARRPAAHWPIALADLRSRLKAATSVGIGEADDALMRAVLGKLFVERQLKVGEEVLSYILARIERSVAAAGPLVARLDAEALATQRPVTIPLVRRVLGETGERDERPDGASPGC